MLDGAKSLQDYAALRAYTGRAKRIYITGLLVTAKPAGISGFFQYDQADTTSADNSGTIIVTADGRRFKRDFIGDVYASWFEAMGDGGDDYAALQKAIDFVQASKTLMLDSGKTYKISQPLVCNYSVNIESTSVKSSSATVFIDGSLLPNGEFCLYLKKTYSSLKGIGFLGDGRRVSGVKAGDATFASNGSTFKACSFGDCYYGIYSEYSVDNRVESCRFDACYIGADLKLTSNTWTFSECIAFNFVAGTSLCVFRVDGIDQVTFNNIWTEINSVPAIIAGYFTNMTIEGAWLEHLLVGNTNPLISIVGPTTGLKSNNLVIRDTDLVINNSVICAFKNIVNVYLDNVRINGLRVENGVYPIIDAEGTDLVRMRGVLHGYVDQPYVTFDNSYVIGATTVIQEEQDNDIVLSSGYQNLVFDSSFKGVTNVVTGGDATVAHDTTRGVYDGNSLRINFGAAGTGLARTANPITVAEGDYIRFDVWAWTAALAGRRDQLLIRFSGPTTGPSLVATLTEKPRKFTIHWKVPAGAAGVYYPFFRYSFNQTGVPLEAYSAWIDDVQVVKSSSPIPEIPYAMNNSLTSPVAIGRGVNIPEHTMLGKRITSGSAAPASGTWAIGDICYHVNPTAGGFIGWVCVAAGAPGSWQKFGFVELTGSIAYNIPSLASGTGVTVSGAVDGAAIGDYVQVASPVDLLGIHMTAWVSAANTVSIRFDNMTGGTVDPAGGTYKIKITKP